MNNELTEIVFLLDRSGSMMGLESDTIGGFNSFIEKQNQMKGKTIITTVLFNDKIEILWNGMDARKIMLTDKEYSVEGFTAMLDAIGKTIIDVGIRLSKTSVNDRPSKVVFVITTDGLENASVEYTYEKVHDLIRHQQEKYNWEFIFLGANIDAAEEAESIGILREDAYNYEASKTGVKTMYSFLCEAVSEKRCGNKLY